MFPSVTDGINSTINKLLLSNNFVRSYHYRRLTRDDTIMEKLEVEGRPSAILGDTILTTSIFLMALFVAYVLNKLFTDLRWYRYELCKETSSIRSRRQQDSSKHKITENSSSKIVQLSTSANSTRYKWLSDLGDVEFDVPKHRQAENIRSQEKFTIPITNDQISTALKIEKSGPLDNSTSVGESLIHSREPATVLTQKSSVEVLPGFNIEKTIYEKLTWEEIISDRTSDQSIPDINNSSTISILKDEEMHSEDDVCEEQNLTTKPQKLEIPFSKEVPTDSNVTETVKEEKKLSSDDDSEPSIGSILEKFTNSTTHS